MSKFDELIDNANPTGVCCQTCADPAREAVRELLTAIHRKKKYGISVPKMYEILSKTEAGFSERVSPASFRHHVAQHEPLWLHGKPVKR